MWPLAKKMLVTIDSLVRSDGENAFRNIKTFQRKEGEKNKKLDAEKTILLNYQHQDVYQSDFRIDNSIFSEY